MDAALGHHGAAKCALDTALHDLVGKRFGVPVHAILELAAEIPPTDFTIGIDEPAIVGQRAARAAHFPALKIKLGGPSDLETLAAVRAVFAGPIRSTRTPAGRSMREAPPPEPSVRRRAHEQPSGPSARRPAALRRSRRCPSSPTSAVTIRDLDRLVGRAGNVKLAKWGPGPAARMLARAKELASGRSGDGGDERDRRPAAVACSPTGSISMGIRSAADPFEGLDLDGECRWRLTGAPPGGLTPA